MHWNARAKAFRLCFINRTTLRPFPGQIPRGQLFDERELKDRLLAKSSSSYSIVVALMRISA